MRALCTCLVSVAIASASAMRVMISGAGGQTGQLVFRKMLSRPETFQPVGLVRTDESHAALLDSGVPAAATVVWDVTEPGPVSSLGGCDAFVICTSAKPAPTETIDQATGRPVFGFLPNGQPQQVDWLGQKAQIDAALAGGVRHIVICSSMGGTSPEHMLNKLGRDEADPSTGNILRWKRKAEVYLIEQCAERPEVSYTVVHPGGLVNEPGGRRELLLGVDDVVAGMENRNVPRDDVAEVLLQALLHPAYRNRSVDLVSKPEGEGPPTADFGALIASCLPNGESCDYKLGKAEGAPAI